MKLIVGLGNPGREYVNTRHNIGFMALHLYALKKGLTFDKEKFKGIFTETKINGEKVIFLKPQKFINLSGEVIKDFINYYKIPIEDILIIHDDLDLKVGNFKIKEKGSSGGHNGLKNIEANLNTDNYKRIKIGISNDKTIDTKDYVLGTLTKEENEKIDCVLDTVCLIIDDYFDLTFNKLIQKYHTKK